MNNPFELLENKLSNIENLLLDLKQQPTTINNKTPKEKLLNVQQAAEFLNLTVPTIYSKVSRGELPFMKRSKRLYFSNLELIDYLKEGRIKTNSEIEELAQSYLSNY